MASPDKTPLLWCPTCGVVWTADTPPLCRHFVPDGPAITSMEPLPSWHPFAEENDMEGDPVG